MLIYLACPRRDPAHAVPRRQGWPPRRPEVDSDGKKLFTLGRFGFVVNLLAVVYGGLMVVNLAWLRAEVFNPGRHHADPAVGQPDHHRGCRPCRGGLASRVTGFILPVTDGDRLIARPPLTDATEESR